MACLTSLRTAAGTIVSGQEIGRQAHEHWQAVYRLLPAYREAALGDKGTRSRIIDRLVAAEEVQVAKCACKVGKAPGPDGLAVEAWQRALPKSIGRCRLASTSGWHMCMGHTRSGYLARGNAIMLRLLAKVRPIALQNASVRVWSRLMLARFEAPGDRIDECSLGFKKGHSVTEISVVFRLLRDRCLKWDRGFCPPARLCGGVRLSRPHGSAGLHGRPGCPLERGTLVHQGDASQLPAAEPRSLVRSGGVALKRARARMQLQSHALSGGGGGGGTGCRLATCTGVATARLGNRTRCRRAAAMPLSLGGRCVAIVVRSVARRGNFQKVGSVHAGGSGIAVAPREEQARSFGPAPELVVPSEEFATIAQVTGEECLRVFETARGSRPGRWGLPNRAPGAPERGLEGVSSPEEVLGAAGVLELQSLYAAYGGVAGLVVGPRKSGKLS